MKSNIPECCVLKPLTDSQLQTLTTKKIYFGHQSVGWNIVEGVRELMAGDPRIRLNIVRSSDPGEVAGPALVESFVGQNGDPNSKIEDFVKALDRGMGKQGGIALCKYCYTDITASTDIHKVFQSYVAKINQIRGKYPEVTIVHVTIPLTAEQAASKDFMRHVIGRPTSRELNIKRNQYNDLLRREYSWSNTMFDLATAESTRLDGSRCFLKIANQIIYTLAPEYTEDGGHLNELGRRVIAKEFLATLAAAERKHSSDTGDENMQGKNSTADLAIGSIRHRVPDLRALATRIPEAESSLL